MLLNPSTNFCLASSFPFRLCVFPSFAVNGAVFFLHLAEYGIFDFFFLLLKTQRKIIIQIDLNWNWELYEVSMFLARCTSQLQWNRKCSVCMRCKWTGHIIGFKSNYLKNVLAPESRITDKHSIAFEEIHAATERHIFQFKLCAVCSQQAHYAEMHHNHGWPSQSAIVGVN